LQAFGFTVEAATGFEPVKGVGEAFGIQRNSSVSSVMEKLNGEMKRNRRLSKNIKSLKAALPKSQT
jgi:hypothetical protein